MDLFEDKSFVLSSWPFGFKWHLIALSPMKRDFFTANIIQSFCFVISPLLGHISCAQVSKPVNSVQAFAMASVGRDGDYLVQGEVSAFITES